MKIWLHADFKCILVNLNTIFFKNKFKILEILSSFSVLPF